MSFVARWRIQQTSIQALPEFHNKMNYIIHYRNLKLYLELGLHLTNVHRVSLFDQSPWLNNYIKFNTRQRKAAKNDFEKDFFKLMNNAVFGKSSICLFVLYSHIFTYSLEVKFFYLWLFVLMYSKIHLLHVKFLSLCFICSCVFIDSFIVDKVFIFIIVCSYVLIHSLQVKFLSLWLFALIYWFIHCR